MESSRHRKLSLLKSEAAARLHSPSSTTRNPKVNVKYSIASGLLFKIKAQRGTDLGRWKVWNAKDIEPVPYPTHFRTR